MDCVKVTYHKEGVCGQTIAPVKYTVGDIPIMGILVPTDSSWDGKYFKITGHIVDIGCVAVYVDKVSACASPKP